MPEEALQALCTGIGQSIIMVTGEAYDANKRGKLLSQMTSRKKKLSVGEMSAKMTVSDAANAAGITAVTRSVPNLCENSAWLTIGGREVDELG